MTASGFDPSDARLLREAAHCIDQAFRLEFRWQPTLAARSLYWVLGGAGCTRHTAS